MHRPICGLLINLVVVVATYAQGTGTFTGKVVSIDGKPIEGAIVTLPDFPDGRPFGESKTDHDGNFTLSIEERDGRTVHRRSPGLQIKAEGYSATYVDARHLTLFPGNDKHLGDIVLDVGRHYSGRVIDQAEQPIAGATVKCGAYRHNSGHMVQTIGSEMSVTTDSNGRFKTSLIPWGTPYVFVHADGYLTEELTPDHFASADPEGRLPDLRLEPDKPIRGLVKDETGEPIQHAEVRANSITAITDADGTFVLRGFGQDAKINLRIDIDGYAFVNWSVIATPDGFDYYDVAKASPVDRLDAEKLKKAMDEITLKMPRLEISLQSESQIRGRVVDAETHAPVTISRIVLCQFTRRTDGEIVLNGCRSSRFKQHHPGEFVVGYWYPTEYHLTVSATGYNDAEAFTSPLTSLQQIDDIVVIMTKTGSTSEGEPQLRQQIHGVVRNHHQFGAGAKVALWSLPDEKNAGNVKIIRGRTTVGDGFVDASAMLEDGRFSLNVPYQRDDWYVLVETPSAVVSLHGPIAVAKGEMKSLEVMPQSPGGLRGFVTNHFSLSVPIYAVLFSDLGIQYETRVRADGHFAFADVYPGNYGLKVGCDLILDTEVPDGSASVPMEKRLENYRKLSQPWTRAKRVVVHEGQVLDGIEVDFEP